MTLDPHQIADLQLTLTTRWHEEPLVVTESGILGLVEENHRRNFELWHEEDIARRDDLGSGRVQEAKRAIDRFNQERNNFIEEIDKVLVAELRPAESGCPKNSETPGMMIDRLSILALKEFHMREETARTDVGDEHRKNCSAKLARILQQRSDLTECLSDLLEEVRAGKRTFAVYFQFKMYNDPALNPQLYAASKSSDG